MRHSFCVALGTAAIVAGCASADPSRDTVDGGGASTGAGDLDGGGAGSFTGGGTCAPDEPTTTPKSAGVRLLSGSGAAVVCPPGTHFVPTVDDAGPDARIAVVGGGLPDAAAPPVPPTALPPTPALCKAGGVNNEPDILVGYAPANGTTVGVGGQIKVWVNDEGAPIIAPNEQIDATTGAITTPGNRAATAPDGYLWEPALYIAPATAENGGTPHFPTAIKGRYNNTTARGAGTLVAGMDPPPAGSVLTEKYTGEDIWDVSSLGLTPGTYIAEFVIHDGDHDRGVGCVTIVVQ